MMWQLDSTLVINNPGTPIETYQMLYAGIDTYQWTFTFYPCTEKLPNDIIFYSDFEDYSVNVSEQYNKNYCKYLCTESGEIISAGYLCYYRDMFTFDGLQQGCWVEFKIRETDTNWDTDVWTCAYNSDVEQDGTVLERVIDENGKTLSHKAQQKQQVEEVTSPEQAIAYCFNTWGIVVKNGKQAVKIANQKGVEFPNLKEKNND